MNSATIAAITAHRADGKTAAESAALLAADPRFAQIATKDDLAELLQTEQTLRLKLRRARDNDALPLELQAGCERILAAAADERGFVDLTNATYAAQFRGGLVALRDNGPLVAAELLPVHMSLTESEEAAILALGGGYLLERLTAEEITAAWAEQDAAAAALAAAIALHALRVRGADAYGAVVVAIDGGETDTSALAAVFAAALEG